MLYTIYAALLFFVIPIGLPVFASIFIRKPHLREYIWISPIVVLVLSVLLSWAYNPYFFEWLFDGYRDGHRDRYFRMVFIIPCLTSAAVTAVCRMVNRCRGRVF
ncbi:MAG: hypothetical protein LBE55_07415 [Clostridiales bacterium]|jgi:drug/metabolite transporter (DMT)-like permease|nr:hypothetical protein [Clostridiales bacterium]